MSVFGDLNGYEKGVTARAFLEQLISQGRFGKSPYGEQDQEIIIPIKPWQLQLLAYFCTQKEVVSRTPNDASPCCDVERRAP